MIEATLPAPYPLTDLVLAQRLERTEAAANAAFVDARASLDPAAGTGWIDVGGVYAMFDGTDSPLTQTFGLGVFGDVTDHHLHQLESFFLERAAPVAHEVSPLAGATLAARLADRGYRPVELSSVLVRPTGDAADTASAVRVRVARPAEADLWAAVSGEGWSSESAELAAFIESFGRIVIRARDTHCFLAELDGQPIAAAALTLHQDMALLAGASTVPAGRRQGAQAALLQERLRFAASHGATLAMMVAQPGSTSHRNAERRGFRNVYTRTKWQLTRA